MQKVKRIVTNLKDNQVWEETEIQGGALDACMHVINVHPEVEYQSIKGFGGAFTEASAHNFYKLTEQNRKEIMEAYFGDSGLRYNVGRIPMNSCDFGLGNYAYVKEGDTDLSNFDISHDLEEIIPFIKEAIDVAGENGRTMRFLTSPWSPPAYMKSNKEMNHGGQLLPEYRSLWASYYAKFIEEYKKQGVALHWYTGDHFEELEMVSKMYPELEMIFTEGCVEYSRFADSNEVDKGEMYAHDILGNLKNGITTYYDWNLILDELGGPNHVKNFCAAPIMANVHEDSYEKRLTYYYIGHFSRYIQPGARRIGSSTYNSLIENVAFLNPDGTRVVVLLNRTDKDLEVEIKENTEGVVDLLKSHSIATYVF